MGLNLWPFPIETPADPAAILETIEHGTLEPIAAIPWSSNAAFIAQTHLNDQATTVICKPQAGEQPLGDFPDGTLCRREVAAYQLSEILRGTLGQALVPPTVLRDTPWGLGAVQQFIDHDPDTNFFTLRDEDANHDEIFRAFALFDCIANNTDRKGGHLILDSNTDQIYGIDHGLTFHLQWKLRTVIWDYHGLDFTDAERAALVAIFNTDLAATFAKLLNPLEIDALQMRTNALLELGHFPEPSGSHRDVPGPLV